jgi:anti-sigma factor RsiW
MTGDAVMNGDHELLHAYHDGEMSRLERWKFERRLRGSPELQRELASLRRLKKELRRLDSDSAQPDVWGGVAQRLPALDLDRAESAAARGSRRHWAWWLTPLGAAGAAAAVVWAVVYGGFWQDTHPHGGVVRWIDSGGRSVLVLDDDPDSTIIWVLDSATEGAARGGPRDVV